MNSIENILKSIFIAAYPFAALLILFYCGQLFHEMGFSLENLGLLVTASVVVIFFSGLFLIPRARTDVYLKVYSFQIAIGFALSLIAYFMNLIITPQLQLSTMLSLGWMLYLLWYSRFSERNRDRLKIGERLEEFQLTDSNKKQISSKTFLGKPSIFLFYRGNWCPLCMAQIKEIAGYYKKLDELGVNTVLISPQPHAQTKKLANKYHLNFHFLVDYKNKVAKQLGIISENGIPAGFQLLGYDSDTVMPTVLITNTKGEIIFVDLTDNYRLRPEPEVFLNILKGSIA